MNITEKYIDFDCGKIYTKHFSKNNDVVIYLGTGNNIGSRALWDFKLPNGKTHAEILCESGVDVVCYDVIGYGSSIGFKGGWDYNRIYNAKQIIQVVKSYNSGYKKNVLFGYCSTTAQIIITTEQTGLIDLLIIHSPSCLEWDDIGFDKNHQLKIKFWMGKPLSVEETDRIKNFNGSAGQRQLDGSWSFVCSVDRMINERYVKVSEKLIPKSNRLPNYEEAMTQIVNTFTHNLSSGWWVAPLGMVEDFARYYSVYKSRGYNPNNPNIPNIVSMMGEYDYECSMGYPKFKQLFGDKIIKEIVLPNATHFSVWENNYQNTLDAIINSCKEL